MVYYYYYLLFSTAVMAKWLAGQTAVLSAQCRFSLQCKAIALPLSMMPLLDRLSIISISNFLKMVNMP